MGSGPQGAKFVAEGNRLSVRGELGPEDEKAYSDHLFALLNSGQYSLELDLTELDYVNSSYIGATSLAVMVARQNKRALKVIAGEKVARVLRMTGIDQMTEVEVV